MTAEELKEMSACGITSLMDAYVTPAEAAVWRRLYDTGKLGMRVRTAIYVADPSDDSDEAVARLVAMSNEGDVDPNFLRAGVVKVFADGVMEYPAQTAALLSPYLDADGKPTSNAGELYFDPQRFASLVAKLDAAGVAVGPLEPYLGPERYRYVYPSGSLHRAGATIAGGSDWDISSYNPFRAFQTGVTRAGGAGQPPLNIGESIPLTTAIDAYTINAAYTMKQDATTGSLEVGKRADLVVLDRDILSADPETIGDTKVLATYLDGGLVYSASSFGGVAESEEESGNWWQEREVRQRTWLKHD